MIKKFIFLILVLPLVFGINTSIMTKSIEGDYEYSIKEKDVRSLEVTKGKKLIEGNSSFLLKEPDSKTISKSITKKNIESFNKTIFFKNNKNVKKKFDVIYINTSDYYYKEYLSQKLEHLTDDINDADLRIKINDGQDHMDFGFNDNLFLLDMNFMTPFSGFAISRNNTIYIYGNSIVGTVNAINLYLENKVEFDKTDYLRYHSDKSIEALKLWDLYLEGHDILEPSFDNESFNISTSINLLHRIRFQKSLLSEKFKNATKTTNNTFVLVNGLWGNLDSSNPFANMLLDEGYDVWQLELTGGEGQECDSCYNYDYNYLVDEALPILLGFVQTNDKRNITYVGHSNGGRVALSMLEKYSEIGLYNMTKNPIDHFVGLGVPGAFLGEKTVLSKMLNYNGKFFLHQNKTPNHISNLRFSSNALDLQGSFFALSQHEKSSKLSKGLLKDYSVFAKYDYLDIPGDGVNISKVTIYAGRNMILDNKKVSYSSDDLYVGLEDQDLIFKKINSNDKVFIYSKTPILYYTYLSRSFWSKKLLERLFNER